MVSVRKFGAALTFSAAASVWKKSVLTNALVINQGRRQKEGGCVSLCVVLQDEEFLKVDQSCCFRVENPKEDPRNEFGKIRQHLKGHEKNKARRVDFCAASKVDVNTKYQTWKSVDVTTVYPAFLRAIAATIASGSSDSKSAVKAWSQMLRKLSGAASVWECVGNRKIKKLFGNSVYRCFCWEMSSEDANVLLGAESFEDPSFAKTIADDEMPTSMDVQQQPTFTYLRHEATMQQEVEESDFEREFPGWKEFELQRIKWDVPEPGQLKDALKILTSHHSFISKTNALEDGYEGFLTWSPGMDLSVRVEDRSRQKALVQELVQKVKTQGFRGWRAWIRTGGLSVSFIKEDLLAEGYFHINEESVGVIWFLHHNDLYAMAEHDSCRDMEGPQVCKGFGEYGEEDGTNNGGLVGEVEIIGGKLQCGEIVISNIISYRVLKAWSHH
jgi:hypothetical protein